MSLNPALVPNYIEVYGRSMKKHTYNQQRVVSERKLTTENVAITKVWTIHLNVKMSWTKMVDQPISRHTDQHQISEFQSGLHVNMAQIQIAFLPDAGMNHAVIVLAVQRLRWTRKSIKATTKTWHNMAGFLLCGATAQLSQKSKVHAKPNKELKTEMEVTSSAAAVTNHRHVCSTALSLLEGCFFSMNRYEGRMDPLYVDDG